VKVVQIIRQKPNLETQRNWGGGVFFLAIFNNMRTTQTNARDNTRSVRAKAIEQSSIAKAIEQASRAGLDIATEVGGLAGQGAAWENLGS
jgi:hypothetical protein